MNADEERGIRLLVATSSHNTLTDITTLLTPYPQISIVGSVTDSDKVLAEIPRCKPTVVVAELNLLPISGVQLAAKLDEEFPTVGCIIIADRAGMSFYREAIHAGARDFLIKPLNAEDLVSSIRSVHRAMQRRRKGLSSAPFWEERQESGIEGKLVVVCSGKGGTGKTFVSTGVASYFAARYPGKVVLIDLSLQFGDVGLFVGLPTERTIQSLSAVMHNLEFEAVETVLQTTPGGLKVLQAPTSPEGADVFTGGDISSLLMFMKRYFPLVIVDSASVLDDALLIALREADIILIVSTPDLPAIRNEAKFLHVLHRLRYPSDHIRVVLNRVSDKVLIQQRDVQRNLGQQIFAVLPDDPVTVQRMLIEGKTCLDWGQGDLRSAFLSLVSRLAPLITTRGLGEPAVPHAGRMSVKRSFAKR